MPKVVSLDFPDPAESPAVEVEQQLQRRREPFVANDLYARAAMAISESARIRATTGSDAIAATPVRLMVDSIAHDLANAVGAAQLSLAALRRNAALAAESADYLRVLERSLGQLAQLVADLRDTRRMQRGDFEVSPSADVSPAALVSEAVKAAGVYADGRRLEAACAPGLPPVRADARRLQRVFANLVGNAIRFTDAPGTITIGAQPGTTAGEVMFFVRDEGEGIPEADQRRIFEPYRQGRGASRSGTGLGLTICRGIVEAHGGHMFVTSRPNSGSTFSFTLRAASARAGEAV